MNVSTATSDQPALMGKASYAACYAEKCIGACPSNAVRNIETSLRLFRTARGVELPITINDEELPANSYVVSPTSTYVRYAQFELREIPVVSLRWLLRQMIRVLGVVLSFGEIDRVVHVNNWLLSTNLHPVELEAEDAYEVLQYVRRSFPNHAIVWRSLNAFSNARLMENLKRSGYRLIASRQVYLFDGRGEGPQFLTHHNVEIDLNALRKSKYEVLEGSQLEHEDFYRLEHLYNLLYLKKYSSLNPQFTADWLRAGVADGWLLIRALRSKEGAIDGVIGFFRNNEVLTAPIVGYDTALPRQTGLYRLLTAMAFREAVESRTLLNFSSGAAHFKRLRGGVPEMEYSAVYVTGLRLRTRFAWRMIELIANRIGVPIMQRFRL